MKFIANPSEERFRKHSNDWQDEVDDADDVWRVSKLFSKHRDKGDDRSSGFF